MESQDQTALEQADKRRGHEKNGKFAKGNHAGKETEFKSGQSGNPGGRPKTKIITKEIEKWLERPALELPMALKAAGKLGLDPAETTVAEVFGLTMLLYGMKGKDGIVKELLKRVEGEVPKMIGIDEGDSFDSYLNEMKDRTDLEGPEKETEDADA